MTNWGLETTIDERVKDLLLVKHKHEHTMGRTWRMLSRVQSRRNMKDEGIDEEDSDLSLLDRPKGSWSFGRKSLGSDIARGHERCRGCWHLHLRHNLKALHGTAFYKSDLSCTCCKAAAVLCLSHVAMSPLGTWTVKTWLRLMCPIALTDSQNTGNGWLLVIHFSPKYQLSVV